MKTVVPIFMKLRQKIQQKEAENKKLKKKKPDWCYKN